MSHAIRIHEFGGPEVLKWEEISVAEPAPGQVRIKQKACALNFIDTYFRRAIIPFPGELPGILGMEAAGTVESIGADVENVKVGDRVVYFGLPGSYAELRIAPADRLVKVPDSLSLEQAAAVFGKGLTAQAVVNGVYSPVAGDTVLLHGAAGGVGSIISQWANHQGLTVIGTVGSEEKATVAKKNGCSHIINYSDSDFVEQVMDITNGDGVAAVFDAVGQSTHEGSVKCLKTRGSLVDFGAASGAVTSVSPFALMMQGSISYTKLNVLHFNVTAEDLNKHAAELFALIEDGVISANASQTYSLADTASAHADLEARKTTGSTVLLVD